ncbi:MAG: Hsp33 family molecular chaperone HslO [Dysosmobacter sp.]
MENDDPESHAAAGHGGFELEILETVPVEYRCYCSRERMTAALVSLGRKQLHGAGRRTQRHRADLSASVTAVQRFTRRRSWELLEKASEASSQNGPSAPCAAGDRRSEKNE